MRRAVTETTCIPTPIGGAHEASASAGLRRGRGIFYTPPTVVDFIVEETLRPLVAGQSIQQAARLRILDPACGCGAFLVGAFRWLCHWHQARRGAPPKPAQRKAIARQLAGIDIDATAVKQARKNIAEASGLTAGELTGTIRTGDALLEHDAWLNGRFDAVLANPPYVNIRRLAENHGSATLDALRQRYRCARGAFDLYVLFLERSTEALRSGGRLGAIIPNKLATLDYARPCRELLLREGSLNAVVDVSELAIFADANVYPYILFWTKRPAERDHSIRILRPPSLAALIASPRKRAAVIAANFRTVSHSSAQESSARGWSLHGELAVESRVATLPLGEVCSIHSGATGFQAAQLAASLVEGGLAVEQPAQAFPFIVSGNIDRYAIRLGDVRFLGRRLSRPLLAVDDPILTPAKRRLYSGPKIVLAGMCRHLEATLDRQGLALGVQVYALMNWKIDPLFLLGLLNSSLLSHLFRLRFAAKRLAGGYFSLSKRQLAQLPIRRLEFDRLEEQRKHDQIVSLVRQRLRANDEQHRARSAGIDAKIDETVLSLYDVSAQELTGSAAAA